MLRITHFNNGELFGVLELYVCIRYSLLSFFYPSSNVGIFLCLVVIPCFKLFYTLFRTEIDDFVCIILIDTIDMGLLDTTLKPTSMIMSSFFFFFTMVGDVCETLSMQCSAYQKTCYRNLVYKHSLLYKKVKIYSVYGMCFALCVEAGGWYSYVKA